jgi:N-methylhydantoinase A
MRSDRALDLRYVGQSYHLPVTLPPGAVTRAMLAESRRRFDEAHLAAYGYAEVEEPCELVNVRVSAIGVIRRPALEDEAACGATPPCKGVRPVWFAATGFTDCAIYDRAALHPGMRLDGPAVIEDRDATTLVHPGWNCAVERYGVLAIRKLA